MFNWIIGSRRSSYVVKHHLRKPFPNCNSLRYVNLYSEVRSSSVSSILKYSECYFGIVAFCQLLKWLLFICYIWRANELHYGAKFFVVIAVSFYERMVYCDQESSLSFISSWRIQFLALVVDHIIDVWRRNSIDLHLILINLLRLWCEMWFIVAPTYVMKELVSFLNGKNTYCKISFVNELACNNVHRLNWNLYLILTRMPECNWFVNRNLWHTFYPPLPTVDTRVFGRVLSCFELIDLAIIVSKV